MRQIESLSQIEEKLNNLSLTAKNNIDNANTHEELDQLRVSLLGKKGDLSIILKKWVNYLLLIDQLLARRQI